MLVPDERIQKLIETGIIDSDQAYFWSDKWQAEEKQVDKEISGGQIETFNTMEEFLEDLFNDSSEDDI